MSEPLVTLRNVVKGFSIKGGFWGREIARVHAVNGVSLDILQGETLSLVGESGCGKSTLGLLLLRLLDVDAGSIHFQGKEITNLTPKQMLPFRREMQIVFQDPFASLNPRMTVGAILEEPLIVHRLGTSTERRERMHELLHVVGLPREAASKYPHEFSGGQRQRIGLARALALTPKLIIADEPVSALDVSIRGEILNLMLRLQEQFGLTFLFISHDLTVVQHVSHRIAVMYAGKIMELFPATEFGQARHPYTQALVSAVPLPQPGRKGKRMVLSGDVPSSLAPPKGCPFHPRCPYAQDRCSSEEPQLTAYAEQKLSACHFVHEMVPIEEGAMRV